jgi:hypothetical protein
LTLKSAHAIILMHAIEWSKCDLCYYHYKKE